MDTLPLHLAEPQPPYSRFAAGRNAGEGFDLLLRAPRDRFGPDDLDASRPREADDLAPHDGRPADARRPREADDLAPHDSRPADASRPREADDVAPRDSRPADAPRPSDPDDLALHDGRPAVASGPRFLGQVDTATAITANAGLRGQSNPGIRDATGSNGQLPAAFEAAKNNGIGGLERPARDSTAERVRRGVVPPPPAQVGTTLENSEAAAQQRARIGGLTVRVSAEQPAGITPPQRTLGGQTALAAQALVAGSTERSSRPLVAAPEDDGPARIRPTAIAKDSGAAKTAAQTNDRDASQVARAPSSAATAAGLTGLSGSRASAGTAITDSAGEHSFGLRGFAASTLGQPAPSVTGYAVQAARPSPGPQAVAEQVAVQIRKAASAGQDRITIRLHPADLGRIDVRMEWADDGVLRAAISAERGETLDLLQRDSRALDRALQEAGLKTDSGSLSFDLRRHAESDGTSRGLGDEPFGGAGSQTQQQADADPAPHERAHDGILDLRV